MESTNNITARTNFFASIRTRVIVVVGLILLLGLFIAGISYATILSVENNLESVLAKEGVVRDLTIEVERNYLFARQNESDFLNSWESIGVESAKDAFASLNTARLVNAKVQVNNLIALLEADTSGSNATLLAEAQALSSALGQYDVAFLNTVNQIVRRSRIGGLESTLEKQLTQLQLAIDPFNNEQLSQLLTDLQLNLQRYTRTTQQQYIDNNRLLLNRFNIALQETDIEQSQLLAMQDFLEIYNDEFDELVTLDQNIAINTAIFREATEDVEASVQVIKVIGEKDFETAYGVLFTTLSQTTVVISVLSVVASLLGIVFAWLLIRRIMIPLTKLTTAAEAVGQGNFGHVVQLKNQDEFLFLGMTFNRMAQQLNEVVGSLEERVAERTRALETSVAVSRQLSTILNEKDLIDSVVKEVQRAFNYYHVHFYDFNEEAGRLNIVGGSGNAGISMIAAGRFIKLGKGVVGTAAKTKQPVLVQDVSTNPDWIYNPLLPETEAELAVPVILGEQVLGVLDVQSNIPNGLDKQDTDLLLAIAGQVSIALNNARSYANLRQKAHFEERISSIGQKIQASPTIESVLQIATRELGVALNAKSTTIQLENPSRIVSNDFQRERKANK